MQLNLRLMYIRVKVGAVLEDMQLNLQLMLCIRIKVGTVLGYTQLNLRLMLYIRV
ncbi:hypothetical protein DPMN_058906 [Dreissena polymorpha]|nr:hypothetical protein DPMN_058906 [Dreissena polymorpha]